MTKRAWVVSVMVGAVLLLAAAPFGVLRYRIAKSAAFCDSVQALPHSELDQYASQCESLLRQRGGPHAGLEFIKDTNILGQFSLGGRRPYEIVVQNDTVGVHFINGNWRYSTSAFWSGEYSSNRPIRVLKITYGTFGWRILCERPVQDGEPDGAANRGQPAGSETNRTSAAAGPGG
jgi:hypothetical protein